MLNRVSPEASDAALAERARAGDEAAFGALYRRLWPLVRGVLLARLPPADADDLTQEVFLRARRKLPSLRDPAAIRPWLCTLARTRAVDFVRARRVHDELDGATHDTGPSPPELVEARRALLAIQELPEAYRETLVLRLVQGMSGPEIAAATGLTPGSVRVNLHRGMALLKERFSP